MTREEKQWRQRDVVIKFEHLNPAVQDHIGVSTSTEFSTVKSTRKARSLFEWLFVASVGVFVASFRNVSEKPPTPNLLALFSAGLAIKNRTDYAKLVQVKYQDVLEAMKTQGILTTEHEGNYPRDWINPTIVANTHPIIHIKRNGDVIFHRPTRLEYARMKFQEKWPGKLGLQPWRWRGYLKKPEAPESVRKWAAKKAAEWAAEAERVRKEWLRRGRPAFAPAPVKIKKNSFKPRTRR